MLKLPYIGLDEITKDKFLISKQILAEFLGTLILVSLAPLFWLAWHPYPGQFVTLVLVSLAP